jgi:hypothetical protein
MANSNPQYDRRHGGPYDRGSADAYYHRTPSPHYYVGATYSSEKVTDLTSEEVAAYMAGYDECTDRKEW